VILTSSEHVFPYSLTDIKLGFNILNLTGFIFAGEVPPDKMYELLTKRWGAGHNVAITLIDHFGGHIYDIHEKLKELNIKRETFRPGKQSQADSIKLCLGFHGDKKRMRFLLTQIAEHGFAPISEKNDPLAEIISENNVGGLVQFESATVIGLPAAVWGVHEIGLVPSKQSIRLLIAKVLEDNPLLEDSPRAVGTELVEGLKGLSAIDEELVKLASNIEDVEAEIKASTDPDEKKLLRKKEELLRKEKEQLRDKELILLRRQDGSDKLFR
jgi:hypothetical protein